MRRVRSIDYSMSFRPITEQIRVMVANHARGHQSPAIPKKDGTGRVLALEILTNTPAVATLFARQNIHVARIIQTG